MVLRVLLHGLGVEGRAAAAHFAGTDAEVLSVDAGGAEVDGVRALGAAEAGDALGPDTLYLRSPGVPPDDALYARAVARGASASTPTGWWLATLAPPGTITVTGTKGKSTTSALTAAALRAAGATSAAYGNIGVPPLGPRLPEEAHPVIELSSYMCADLIAPADGRRWRHAVTNLYKEHTAWHGGEAAYRAAKLTPFRWSPPCQGAAPAALIAREGLTDAVGAIEDAARLDGAVLSVGDGRLDLAALSDAFRSPGLRLAARAAAAILSPILGAGTLEALAAAGRDWRGLPSRQAALPSADGRLWIDDALATVPEATAQALDRFADRPVRLILGGRDRGQDLGALLARVAAAEDVRAYGFGEIAGQVEAAGMPVFGGMEAAVSAARADCPPGGVVLFSPAAPSAPPHRDYKERAALFARLAEKAR